MGIWNELSNEISQAVQGVGKSIVTVQGRDRTSSGIILDESTVITAAHTVHDETNARVWISPDQPFTASVQGRDSGTDIAVLKTEEKVVQSDARPAQFAEDPQLAVGQFVVAIARTWRGNVAASSGILSGLMGEWRTQRGKKVESFIRPDLLLYRGFSGGALIGADRKIIGMMTPFLRRGSPLAVPYSTIKRITTVLLEKGYIPTPYLGLGLQPVRVPESLKQKLNLTEHAGALVVHVEPQSPADKAGLLVGDVVLKISNFAFGEESTVSILSRLNPGEKAEITGIRGGQTFSSSVNVGERPHR
jgi:serine protease DegQ